MFSGIKQSGSLIIPFLTFAKMSRAIKHRRHDINLGHFIPATNQLGFRFNVVKNCVSLFGLAPLFIHFRLK